MKLSIITVVKNGAETIEETIRSVIGQTYHNIEYLIIDGGSSDGTAEIIKRYEARVAYWVSEPDKGIYDGMNKGIKAATGDVVGILNADDIYADDSGIESVATAMFQNKAESCYADLAYVDRKNVNKVVRYWMGGQFSKERFKRG